MTFGQFMGATYGGVWRKHPSYCNWALSTVESGDSHCPQLKKFAHYVASKEARGPEDIPAGAMDEEL
jgi:hypothetical protein